MRNYIQPCIYQTVFMRSTERQLLDVVLAVRRGPAAGGYSSADELSSRRNNFTRSTFRVKLDILANKFRWNSPGLWRHGETNRVDIDIWRISVEANHFSRVQEESVPTCIMQLDPRPPSRRISRRPQSKCGLVAGKLRPAVSWAVKKYG